MLKEIDVDTVSTQEIDERKETSATIIDFMAVVQSSSTSKCGIKTFSELRNHLESSIKAGLKESKYIGVVPDRYDFPISIKSDERSRRQRNTSVEIAISNDTQNLPKTFEAHLGNPRNKINLVNYVFKSWSTAFWTDSMH